ncbi:MAG: hypothetical protein IPH77_16685 [Ignavibacteria bacterium]|nr:hypothetical protein [Ignavibacteria bacterium]
MEGSTKLSQNFPEILSEILAKHNSILNEAVESHNGFVFKMIGDAFCCSFQMQKMLLKRQLMLRLNYIRKNGMTQ